MSEKNIYSHLPDALLPWYEENHRDLPWRVDSDPYHIWLSEIMLQQTRVEAVKDYYHRFISKLPTVQDLAKADDELLHKLWEGLGYYTRVRNLKKAAQQICEEYGGEFPGQYEQLIRLPGIGDYTAGAISSIAFHQPVPAVDGNVLRVAARLTNDDSPIDHPTFKKKVRDALGKVYPEDTASFTQALMELGATLCGPNRKPLCEQCPCASFCLGYRSGTAESLPVKSPKRKRRSEDMTVLILRCGDKYAIEKRPDSGLLAGLWQFPNVPGKLDVQEAVAQAERLGTCPVQVLRQLDRQHIFTHIQWNMRGIYLDVTTQNEQFAWMTEEQINGAIALPTAFRQFWEEIHNV